MKWEVGAKSMAKSWLRVNDGQRGEGRTFATLYD